MDFYLFTFFAGEGEGRELEAERSLQCSPVLRACFLQAQGTVWGVKDGTWVGHIHDKHPTHYCSGSPEKKLHTLILRLQFIFLTLYPECELQWYKPALIITVKLGK